jgi:hypothetical protein
MKILNQYTSVIGKTPGVLEALLKETRPCSAILHLTC